MRLNAHKAGAAPKDRADRLRRSRAAAQALRAAFPLVRELRLEFRFEAGSLQPPAAQSHLLYPPAQAFFEFPCPHADCDGQFDLTTVVRGAMDDHAHSSRGTIECAGTRASEGGSRQSCRLHLIYSVTALL